MQSGCCDGWCDRRLPTFVLARAVTYAALFVGLLRSAVLSSLSEDQREDQPVNLSTALEQYDPEKKTALFEKLAEWVRSIAPKRR